MKRLAIFIPTHNRPDCIKYYLERQYENFVKYKIHVFIYDSSSDNRTQEVVQRYLEKNNNCLIYKAFDESVSTPARAREFVREYMNEFDYMWTCGDGAVLKIDEIYPVVEFYMNQGYDVIHLDNKDFFEIGKREYDDCQKFFHDCGWRLTLYGASIISYDVAKMYLDENLLVQKYGGTGFALQMIILEYCAYNPIKTVHYVYDYIEYNSYKTSSGWSKEVIQQWVEKWCRVIDLLPEVYNPEKEYVIQSHHRYARFFDTKNLVRMRANGMLQRREIVRNKSNFIRCIGNRYYEVMLASLIPIPLLASAKHVYKLVAKKT